MAFKQTQSMPQSALLFARELLPRTLVQKIVFVVFGGLFLFELLNYTNVLSFKIEFTWFGRVMSTFVLFAILRSVDVLFQRKLGTHLQSRVWFIMTFLLFFDFFGDILGLYGKWTSYDQVVHFLSGPALVASLILVFERIADRLNWRSPRAVTYGLALGTSTIFAVLYEVEEYLEDFFFGTHRLGDGPDTANDLMLNMIGGVLLIAVFVGYRAWQNRKVEQDILSRSGIVDV